MWKIIYKITFGILILTGLNTNLNAQKISHFSNEQVILFTDRTIYVINEEIQFSCNLIHNEKSAFGDFSNVLYVELVTPIGESVISEKFKLINSYCSSKITIPDNILTGYYYIKAYTKVMRNKGPNSYYYTRLKIINPYKDDLVSYNSSQTVNESNDSKKDSLFIISANKKVYSNREKVNVTIKCESGGFENKCVGISVIPEFSFNAINLSASHIGEISSDEFYNLENKGISITGKTIDEKTGLNLPKIKINLSIIGVNRDFMATVSDSLGNFVFVLPDLYGQNSIFISCQKKPDITPKIMVLNDFCTYKNSIETPSFKLTEEERKLVYKIAVNNEIKSIFQDTSRINKPFKTYDNVFYGNPTRILYPDKYIDLPTIEDCFVELPFNVRIIKVKDEKYFKITGGKSEFLIYEPLILVDMVAITDYKKVLGISPKIISHIDIITAPYVKGNMIYGGIISIFSKNGDYGGINLPESGIFLDYNFFSENSTAINSTYAPINKPDIRNTLLWLPNLVLSNNNTADFDFSTSDSDGKYVILIRAVKNNGETVVQTEYFEVQ